MAEYQQRKCWKRQANTVISRKFYGPHKHILRCSTENSSARTQKFFWWSDGINTQHAHAQVHVSSRARVWSRAHLTPIFCRLSEFSHQSTRKRLFQNVLSSNTICPIHSELWCLPKWWKMNILCRGLLSTVGLLVVARHCAATDTDEFYPTSIWRNCFSSPSNFQFCMCKCNLSSVDVMSFWLLTVKWSFYLTIIQLL